MSTTTVPSMGTPPSSTTTTTTTTVANLVPPEEQPAPPLLTPVPQSPTDKSADEDKTPALRKEDDDDDCDSAEKITPERRTTRSKVAEEKKAKAATKKSMANRPRPANRREKVAVESPWKECHVHRPSLEELQSQSFSDYVRHTVLRAATLYEEDEQDESETNNNSRNNQSRSEAPKRRRPPTTSAFESDDVYVPLPLSQGIAKVSLPDGFWKEEGIAKDRTARGPQWQKGTPLGDYDIGSPIQQNIRGLAGVYEYTFTEQRPLTLSEFRDKADAYRKEQVGCAVDEFDTETKETTDSQQQQTLETEETNGNNGDEGPKVNKFKDRMAYLERLFWKRLGPTMPPAWYGADQEGTLFGDDEASGWSIANLDSCLHVLSYVPGVTSPYLYLGMWASVFCCHTEDMNLLSINYLHAGAPKVWYAVAPGKDSERLDAFATFQFGSMAKMCKEFLRHKRCLMSPHVLHKAGIPFTTVVQQPGEAVITFPGGYHFGFNAGFNVAEATNFGVPEWIPFGERANVCLCRPDSVRIDMRQFIRLLKRYEADQKGRRRGARLTWKQWREKEEEKKKKEMGISSSEEDSDSAEDSEDERENRAKRTKLSGQQRRKEFWVEVMKPLTTTAPKSAKKDTKKGKGRKGHTKVREEPEIWHLAQPVRRKDLVPDTRVLVILPARRNYQDVAISEVEDDGIDSDEEDEQCFAGYIRYVLHRGLVNLSSCTTLSLICSLATVFVFLER